MRNAVVLGAQHRVLPQEPLPDVAVLGSLESGAENCISSVAVQHTTGTTAVLLQQGLLLVYSEDACEVQSVFDLGNPSAGWRWVFCFPDTEAIGCFSSAGSIVEVDEAGETKEVGSIEAGIHAVAVSPDQEHVAIVTGNDTLLVMTCRWEVLHEVPLPAMNKSARTAVSWKHDGSKLAVLAQGAEDGVYRVRIFDQEAAMQAVGRNEDGSLVKDLAPALAWSKDGSLIGAYQLLRKKHQIVFFETNGLRHRECPLQLPYESCEQVSVSHLEWNLENDKLAVVLQLIVNGQTISALQIYHRDNYYWYLKHERLYQQQHITAMNFDLEKPHRMFVALRDAERSGAESSGLSFVTLDFGWESLVSMSPDATAVVVDGASLNITPLGVSMVPPPMSTASLRLPSACVHAALLPLTTECLRYNWMLVALSSNGHVTLFDGSNKCTDPAIAGTARGYNPPTQVTSFDLSTVPGLDGVDMPTIREVSLVRGASGYHLAFLATLACEDGSAEELLVVHLSDTLSPANGSRISLPEQMTCIKSDVLGARPTLFLAAHSGCTYRTTLEPGTSELEEMDGALQFPEPCSQFIVIPNANIGQDAHDVSTVGLTFNSRLYVGEHIVHAGVNSMSLNLAFGMLLFATIGTRPAVHFVPVSALFEIDILQGEDQLLLSEMEAPRPVERGAYVVCTVNDTPKVVIQLPRGNLEGFEPRPLILQQIYRLLELERLGDALTVMRRQRVDMNLAADHHPGSWFVQRLPLLVEQAATIEVLNLFISALRNENVVATKYRPPAHTAFQRSKPEVEGVDGWDHVTGAGKVNVICRELRLVMMAVSRDKYMLPILTTFARESPQKLEEGLALIVEDANAKQLLLKSHHVQSAIKYFVFLVSADELFDTALGMYDFNLARAVARQSQKDPRQYQPLLEAFENIDDVVFQRYRVNLHLTRIEKALDALSEILQKQQFKEFAEYVELADKHDLQEHALALLPRRGTQQVRNHLMLSLGKRLQKNGHNAQAMQVFLSSRPAWKEAAAHAARQAKDWRMALAIAQSDGKMDLQAFAAEIANELRYGTPAEALAASQIYVEYWQDDETAVSILIGARQWDEAIRTCLRLGRHDVLDSDVMPAVEEAADAALHDIESRKGKIDSYLSEIADLWRQRSVMMNELVAIHGEAYLYSPEGDGQGQFADTASQYSAATFASRASNVSTQSDVSTSSAASATSSFSVEGVAHSMLGTGVDSSQGEKKSKKHKKKHARTPLDSTKGSGKLSFTREYQLCTNVLQFLDIGTLSAEVQSLCKALLFFGLGEVSDKVAAKMKTFVDGLEQIEFPVPPTYPTRMLGNHAKDLPQLLNRLRMLTIRRPVVEQPAQILTQDPRLSWAQFRTETSY